MCVIAPPRSHILVDSSCDQPTTVSDDERGSTLQLRGRVPGGRDACTEWDVPANHSTVTFAGRDNVTHHIEKGLHLRLEWLHTGGGPALLKVLWRQGTPSTWLSARDAPPFVAVPPSALAPTITPAELWRQDLQRGLSKGWNTWMRDNAMRHLHLPSGFGVEVQLWDIPVAEPGSEPLAAQVDIRGLVDKCRGADADS